ncbi:BRO-N domain-containing protein [Vogesella indigofera]|uniref:BRO-N domain-containing protein n=1 Tax=Vogesella indigofera TaxID=45465 RepID=UPI00234C8002|nr:Bro-N domain-containing protein [Vogesella indigofera]MDC7704055.1 Bro-N domain-containing protein [Vogesella indigofera]
MNASTQPATPQVNTLSFQETKFDVVSRCGQPWLMARQIGQALGYAREDAINKIYERNSDEFTPNMSCNVKLTLQGQQREVRVFSLRGAHLIGMFARTAAAKAFRKWVLDILDAITAPSPLPDTRTPRRGQHAGGQAAHDVSGCLRHCAHHMLESCQWIENTNIMARYTHQPKK